MNTLINEITDLIPLLEADKNYAEIKEGYYYYNQTVKSLIKIVHKMADELSTKDCDLHDYNKILETIPDYKGPNEIKNIDNLSKPQLLALLICIIRAEHFCEGTIYDFLQNGRLINLLKKINTI